MSGLVDALVALYAEHGLEDVKRVDAYQRLCREHRDDPALGATLNRVRDVLERLEKSLGGTHRDQVKNALSEVSGYRRDSERLEICRELVARRWAPYWSDAQRAHFEDGAEKLASWHHYFLSFTTYHPTPGEVLAVNNRHQRLIDYGLKQRFQPTLTTRENLLARLVQYLLEVHNLRGYYYPNHHHSRPVTSDLRAAAGRSLTFVQILQSSMFARAQPNYCKTEYDAAVAGDASLVPVMSEPRAGFVMRVLVDNDLRDWYDDVLAHQGCDVRLVSRHAEVVQALAELEDYVVDRVHRAIRRIFDTVPA